MKKETFVKKLASTKITDANTVAEMKAANRTKTQLARFLKKAALAHILETQGEELNEQNWVRLEFEFNLNPTGTIIINELSADPLSSGRTLRSFIVPKRDLFK